MARAWRVRERVEREAALLFAGLAAELATAGVDRSLVRLAEQAARDEHDHATRCRRIVDARGAGLADARGAGLADLAPLPFAAASQRLGPTDLTPRQRLLYEAVAISCVTETMSVALLGAMRPLVRDDLVADTVHHILADEIDHARLGWAVLAAEARRGSTAWLAPHVPGMVSAALRSEAPPADAGAPADLSNYGILTRARVVEVVREALDDVILPGLRSFEIPV